mmetsp:Transcript_28113/g.66545  ORF Transcript_28113/g.66545 Transcript_28113/m.66545 type:complete len:235 (+) Transcript_28113:764-1468(+)
MISISTRSLRAHGRICRYQKEAHHLPLDIGWALSQYSRLASSTSSEALLKCVFVKVKSRMTSMNTTSHLEHGRIYRRQLPACPLPPDSVLIAPRQQGSSIFSKVTSCTHMTSRLVHGVFCRRLPFPATTIPMGGWAWQRQVAISLHSLVHTIQTGSLLLSCMNITLRDNYGRPEWTPPPGNSKRPLPAEWEWDSHNRTTRSMSLEDTEDPTQMICISTTWNGAYGRIYRYSTTA